MGKIGDVGILPHLRSLLADTTEEARDVTQLGRGLIGITSQPVPRYSSQINS